MHIPKIPKMIKPLFIFIFINGVFLSSYTHAQNDDVLHVDTDMHESQTTMEGMSTDDNAHINHEASSTIVDENIIIDGKRVGIYETLGNFIDLDTQLTSDIVGEADLRTIIDNKPTIIVPIFYSCAAVCPVILEGLVEGVRRLPLVDTTDYNVIVASFDARDNLESASLRKKQLMQSYDRQTTRDLVNGWHFTFLGTQDKVDTFFNSIGFYVQKELDSNDQWHGNFIHPSSLIMVSPQGKITRYFYGVRYLAKDMQLGLLEAGEGQVRPTITRILDFCFSYDPESRSYLVNLQFIIGLFISILAIVFLVYLIILGRKKGDKNEQYVRRKS